MSMDYAAGFGLNFYGYFLFAGFWVGAYFIWAWRVNTRERARTADRESPPEQQEK